MDFLDTRPRSNLPASYPPKKVGVRMNIRGAGALILAKETGRLLFALRAVKRDGEHEWNLWGGKLYLHESPETGVIRSTKEQTGYNGNFLDVEQIYSFLSLYTNFRYYNYILVVQDEFTPTINRTQIDHYQWAELDDLPTPLHPVVKELINRTSHKIKAIIEKNFIKENLEKDAFHVIKLKDFIKELW